MVLTELAVARWQVGGLTSTEESPEAAGRIPVASTFHSLPWVHRCLWLGSWARLSCLQGTRFLKLGRPEGGRFTNDRATAGREVACLLLLRNAGSSVMQSAQYGLRRAGE